MYLGSAIGLCSPSFQDEPSFGVTDHGDAVCFTSVFSVDPYSEMGSRKQKCLIPSYPYQSQELSLVCVIISFGLTACNRNPNGNWHPQEII